MAASPRERFEENAAEIAGSVVTGIWLVALLTGQEWWLAAMLIGYLIVLPIVSFLTGETDELDDWWGGWGWGGGNDAEREADDPVEFETHEDDGDAALDTLRERYARGELTDEQFERKLDRLLDAETLEDVEDRWERERERERS